MRGGGCCVVLSLPLSRIFDHIQFNVIDCYKDDNTNISTSHPRESSMPRSCVSTSLMFELAIVNYFLRLLFLIHSLPPPLFLSKCMQERFVCYFLLHPKLLSNLYCLACRRVRNNLLSDRISGWLVTLWQEYLCRIINGIMYITFVF